MFEDFDMIYSYTRKQAIEDGVLIEVNQQVLAMCGISVHTVVTATLYNHYNFDEHDLSIFMVSVRIEIGRQDQSIPRFTMKYKDHDVIVDIGPGDEGEPVLTIGFSEDF